MVLSQLFDSKSKISLLEKMAGKSEKFSVSELSRFASLPKATVSGIIIDWENAGLIECEFQGRNKLVKLNKRFSILPEIEKICSKAQNLQKPFFEKIKRIKALKSKNVLGVIVFGSRARKDFTSKSDIDILIILKNEKNDKTELKLAEEFTRLSVKSETMYSPVFLTKDNVISRIDETDEFIKNVLLDGKIIAGDKFVRKLQTAQRFGKRKIPNS